MAQCKSPPRRWRSLADRGATPAKSARHWRLSLRRGGARFQRKRSRFTCRHVQAQHPLALLVIAGAPIEVDASVRFGNVGRPASWPAQSGGRPDSFPDAAVNDKPFCNPPTTRTGWFDAVWRNGRTKFVMKCVPPHSEFTDSMLSEQDIPFSRRKYGSASCSKRIAYLLAVV